MPGKRISELTALSGAGSANNDDVLIFDVDAGETKRISRSQLADGLVGDLPYVPAGFVTATTVPTAIAEIVADLSAAGGAALIGNTPAGTIAATTVQAAINELAAEKQPLDAGLTSIAGLTTAANKMIYTTAADVYAVADLTAAGRALLDDADATAQRVTLGLEIGVNVQAYDADTAKTDVVQTFTAQQTVTSGLVLQSVAATSIAAVGNALNTTNKVQGKVVYDTTNNRLMVASGAAAADAWYVADGSASVVPA
jgi:hypothetical protein